MCVTWFLGILLRVAPTVWSKTAKPCLYWKEATSASVLQRRSSCMENEKFYKFKESTDSHRIRVIEWLYAKIRRQKIIILIRRQTIFDIIEDDSLNVFLCIFLAYFEHYGLIILVFYELLPVSPIFSYLYITKIGCALPLFYYFVAFFYKLIINKLC